MMNDEIEIGLINQRYANKILIRELINNLRSLQMINRNESCLFADYYYKVNDIQELIKKLEDKLK